MRFGIARSFLPLICIVCFSLARLPRANAQGYTDVTWDGTDINTDAWDDAPEPGVCPGYISIESTINGYSGFAQANYPNTANVRVSTPASVAVTYEWARTISHYGEQRGGNCGIIAQPTIIWPVSIRTTFWGPPPIVTEGTGYVNCQYTNLACSSGTLV